MSKLIAVISPAKLLDDQTHYPQLPSSQPLFLDEAEALIKKLKKLTTEDVADLMDLSPALGSLNRYLFNQWKRPFDTSNAHQAILHFKGEVYRAMMAGEFG